jgi:hypothetical protein
LQELVAQRDRSALVVDQSPYEGFDAYSARSTAAANAIIGKSGTSRKPTRYGLASSAGVRDLPVSDMAAW